MCFLAVQVSELKLDDYVKLLFPPKTWKKYIPLQPTCLFKKTLSLHKVRYFSFFSLYYTFLSGFRFSTWVKDMINRNDTLSLMSFCWQLRPCKHNCSMASSLLLATASLTWGQVGTTRTRIKKIPNLSCDCYGQKLTIPSSSRFWILPSN